MSAVEMTTFSEANCESTNLNMIKCDHCLAARQLPDNVNSTSFAASNYTDHSIIKGYITVLF